MTRESRHEELILAGWHYDAPTDRYRAPKSADDGTARMYNQDAAYAVLQHRLAEQREAKAAKKAEPTAKRDSEQLKDWVDTTIGEVEDVYRKRDPRQKEPE